MSPPLKAAFAVCFWTAVALIFVLPQLAQSEDWQRIVLSSIAQWWSWGLLSLLITTIDGSLPASGRRFSLRLILHLILAPSCAVAYVYLSACLDAVLEVGSWSRLADPALLALAWHEMFWSLLVYGLILGVWEVYQHQRRYASAELRMQRLERNFAEARLNGLRMQLDPHFLFNALNTISAHTERDPRLARTMIEHLGDLLRLSLDSRSRAVVTLAEELAFLEHYLAIQRIRFGDRLSVQPHVPPELQHALVPSLLLQPLVENAIRHGLAPRSEGGHIIIDVASADDLMHVRILDDGVGLPEMWSPENQVGVGLSVTRERIAGLHPKGSGQFSIHRRTTGGTAVEISLPLSFSEAVDERHIG